MAVGEIAYLALVIGAFAAFMIALAWAQSAWQPKEAAPKSPARRERLAA